VSREAAIRDTHTAEYKQKLREKFVGQAKKYFGVPYARRYWSKDGKKYCSVICAGSCLTMQYIERTTTSVIWAGSCLTMQYVERTTTSVICAGSCPTIQYIERTTTSVMGIYCLLFRS